MTNDKDPQETHGASAREGAAVHGAPHDQTGAAWGKPIMAADQAWTRFEIYLAMLTFVLEAFSMALWVCLKGFSASPDHPSSVVFRGVVGATVLGITAHVALAKQAPRVRTGATLAGVFVGLIIAKAWVGLGGDYASNVLNWYQQASFLTLLGGLRGVGTRLTMLLALVGGSLATARGRHIVIDILTKFVSPTTRRNMVLVGWVSAAFVCVVAGWGFFDHIAIESFEANADDPGGKKVAHVFERLEEDVFIARKQIALDMKAAPHILLRNEPYADWLTGKEWNEWVDSAGFQERYGLDGVNGIKIPETETRPPLVVIPGRGEPRGELINAAFLVFPIGLWIIAMRFLVRALLVLSGHVGVESDESEDFGGPQEEPDVAQ